MTNVYLIGGFAQGLFDSDKAPKIDDLFQRPAKGTSILSAKAGGAVEREFGKKNLDSARGFVKSIISKKDEKKLDIALRLLGIDTNDVDYAKAFKSRLTQKEGQLIGLVALANKAGESTQGGKVDLATGLKKLSKSTKAFIDKISDNKQAFDKFVEESSSGVPTSFSELYADALTEGLAVGQVWATPKGKDSELARAVKALDESMEQNIRDKKKGLEVLDAFTIGEAGGEGEGEEEEFISEVGDPEVQSVVSEGSLTASEREAAGLSPKGPPSVEDLDETIARAERITNLPPVLHQGGAAHGNPDYSESLISAVGDMNAGASASSFSQSLAGSQAGQEALGFGRFSGGEMSGIGLTLPNSSFFAQGNANNIPPVPPVAGVNAATQASFGQFGTSGMVGDENALIVATQIARQNALIKSNVLKKNQNSIGKQFRKRDVTFEEYLKIIEARELEAFKLNVDVLTADYRNTNVQEAQRLIDMQRNSNERWGVPLVK